MAASHQLWIPGPVGRLEAAVRVSEPTLATVVVAHPHPLHGGTLHNPVVFHTERALHALGATTLRFNFRGAGASEGEHDEGRGEVDDLAAAASWIRGLAPAAPSILAGYSFGAWCAVRLAEREPSVRAVLAIGLPLDIYEFGEIERLARPIAVVQGQYDELGSADEVRRLLERARPPGRLRVVEGADHRFSELARSAATEAQRAFSELLDEVGSEG